MNVCRQSDRVCGIFLFLHVISRPLLRYGFQYEVLHFKKDLEQLERKKGKKKIL